MLPRNHPRDSRQTPDSPIARVEALETRQLLSANVLTHHSDNANDGQNLSETVLSPSNVNPVDFGKQFTTSLDGAIYAQPLYMQQVNIARGVNLGARSVLFVATLHDSLYALDAGTGAILWQDSFLNLTDPTNLNATAGVTTVPSSALSSNNLGKELGILATPAIDAGTGELFLTTNTQEIRGGNTHFVQRLWAVNVTDGSATNPPALIGDTIFNSTFFSFSGYQYVAGPIVNGTGNNTNPTSYPNTDGWAAAPGGATGPVIAFNALLQMGRTAVTLMGGNVYLGFASHGDNGPYYGWILGYSESNLALTAAFVTTPTFLGIAGDRTNYTAQGGIWTSGSGFAADGTNLFITTGNGAFNAAPDNFDAQGFPIDHNYGDSLLKLAVDPSSSPTGQNGNGWGLKVADYFTPSNELALNQSDLDLGSGGTLLLPNSLTDSAGNPMLVVGGKESRVYLIDRNNLGKFNTTYPTTGTQDPRLYDRVLGEYPSDLINHGNQGVFSTPSYFDGKIYVGVTLNASLVFDAATFASPTSPPGVSYTPTPLQKGLYFSYPGPTFAISANGTANGIVWGISFSGSDLLGFDSTNIATALYDSSTITADRFTGAVKFAVPTVANGMVYLATTSGTVNGFGLRSSYLDSNPAFFSAATGLIVSAVSPTDVHLAWTSHSTFATEFRIDRSADGSAWTPLAVVDNSTRAFDDISVPATPRYFYRVVAVSGANSAVPSNTADLSSLNLSGQNFYLKLDADHQHLDIWNNATGAGIPDQQVQSSLFDSILVTGSIGGDSLTLDASNGNFIPPVGLSFTGTGPTLGNTLRILGTSTGADSLSSSPGQAIFNGTVINFSDVGDLSFSPGTGTDALAVDGTTLSLAGANGAGITTERFSTISVAAGGRLNVLNPTSHGNRVLVNTTSLNLAGTNNSWTATLDLNGNDLEVSTGDLATITNQLASGHAGGTWTGTGIVSSVAAGDSSHLTTLGAILNTSIYGTGALGMFDGSSPPINAMLVKFTYVGDANLDGQVDGSDYTLIDNGFNTNRTGWINGDFNYDGKVDGSDYSLIDGAFTAHGASLATQRAGSIAEGPVQQQQVTTSTAALANESAIPFDDFVDTAFTEDKRRHLSRRNKF